MLFKWTNSVHRIARSFIIIIISITVLYSIHKHTQFAINIGLLSSLNSN